jgi:hypothetical protein
MLFLFLLLVLLGTAAGVWFSGLWSGAITLVNLILAATIATCFYEPICAALEGVGAVASYTYLLDFVVLWLLFAITFAILRAFTDALSKESVEFPLPVEIGGRSIFALACGWIMVCFVAFSLHMAPLNSATPLGGFESPSSKTFAAASPDRMWLGYMYSRSRPAMFGGNQFDPNADFLLRYRERRVKFAAEGASLTFQR